MRFRIGIEDQRERNHSLLGVALLPRPRDHLGDAVRLRHRYVECRVHDLRTLRGKDPVLRQIQQSDAEVFHGSKREVPQ